MRARRLSISKMPRKDWVDDRMPIGVAHRRDRLRRGEAGAVDESVEPAEMFDGSLHGRGGVGGSAHIGLDDQALPRGTGGVGDRLPGSADQGQAVSVLGQQQCRGTSDTRAGRVMRATCFSMMGSFPRAS